MGDGAAAPGGQTDVPSPQRIAGTRRFGCFEVDLRAGELRKQGARIRLEDQPFQILAVLLERPGELVTREELKSRLWPAQTFVDFDRRLNVAVARLRFALGDSRDNPRYIETLYRRGYRLLAPVAPQPQAERIGAPPPAPEAAPPLSEADPAAAASVGPLPGRQARPLLLAGAAALALAGLLAASRAGLFGALPPGPPAGAAGPRRSVAVLGLKNLSGAPRHAWLSTALAEWLTTELQAGEHLRTISAQSVARMEMDLALSTVDATARDNLLRIRRNLGTELVVVGSYAVLDDRLGEQIRLDLRLLDAESGDTVAALSETGVEAHLLALVSKAGVKLRSKLGIPPITEEEEAALSASLPSAPRAARLYSEGLARLHVFDARAARDLLLNAVALEPGHALSHAALATAWAELGHDRRAADAARRALDLSHGLSRSERLLIKGRYHEMRHDWKGAEDVYQALFQFFPDNLEYGLALADAQIHANRWKEVLATVAALRALPPPLQDDPRIDLAESIAARTLGDHERSQASGARAVERSRALGASLTLAKALVEQAWDLQSLGRTAESDRAARESESLYRSAGQWAGATRAATMRAHILYSDGDYRGAWRIYEDALAKNREIGHQRGIAVAHVNLGCVLVDMGDIKAARRSFEDALSTYTEIGDPGGVTLAKLDLGAVLVTMGEHAEARRLLEEALDGARQMGDPSRAARTLLALAELLQQEGDPEAARRSAQEALSIYRRTGSASDAAYAELALAENLLEQGDAAQAVAVASRAAGALERERNGLAQPEAQALAAWAFLQQGRIGEARRALEKAASRGGAQSRKTALEVAIASARLAAADPALAAGNAEARKRLRAVIQAAEGAEFVKCALEARLALAEIEMQSGDVLARQRLQMLEQDALRKGFQSIGRRAASTLARARAAGR